MAYTTTVIAANWYGPFASIQEERPKLNEPASQRVCT